MQKRYLKNNFNNSQILFCGILLFVLFLNNSVAGQLPLLTITPESPFVGDNITANVFVFCPLPATDENGMLKKNVIIEENTVKLLVYSSSDLICPPVTPPGYFRYDLGNLGLEDGIYTLELYILDEDIPFPLPDNFPLALYAEIQFSVTAPIVINSSSNLSIIVFTILILILKFRYRKYVCQDE